MPPIPHHSSTRRCVIFPFSAFRSIAFGVSNALPAVCQVHSSCPRGIEADSAIVISEDDPRQNFFCGCGAAAVAFWARLTAAGKWPIVLHGFPRNARRRRRAAPFFRGNPSSTPSTVLCLERNVSTLDLRERIGSLSLPLQKPKSPRDSQHGDRQRR